MRKSGRERKRDRHRHRVRQRQRQRDRDTERQRQRDRDRETETETERQRQRDREIRRRRDTETERYRDREIRRRRQRQRQRQRERERERERYGDSKRERDRAREGDRQRERKRENIFKENTNRRTELSKDWKAFSVTKRPIHTKDRLLTSRGVAGLAGGARLPLVGVRGGVELRRAHVEEHRALEVIHNGQTTTVTQNHTGGERERWRGRVRRGAIIVLLE
jgi:hypothetical protein